MYIYVMVDIGAIIKKVRKEKGYNQTELAALAGCTQLTITNIESGKKSPTFKMLEKICNVLDIEEIKFKTK